MKRFVLIAALALAACGSIQPTPQTPQQAVYALKGDYAAAISVAVQYKGLPPCATPSTTFVCSDPAVVGKLQQADNVAWAAIQAAENTVRDPNATTNVSMALSAAQNAVAAFQSIASTLKLQ